MSQYEFSVSAQVQFLPEESDPERRQYAFAYTLTIRNTGQVPAQLIAPLVVQTVAGTVFTLILALILRSKKQP